MLLNFVFVEDVEDDYEVAVGLLTQYGLQFNHIRIDTRKELILAFADADVLFVDCAIPELSCTQSLALWTSHGRRQPFIVLSGTIKASTAALYMTLGATNVVLKDEYAKLGVITERALEDFDVRKQVQVQAIDGSVIHNIRNSLTVIESHASLMAYHRKFDGDSCTDIIRGVSSILAIIDTLGIDGDGGLNKSKRPRT